MGEKAKKSVLTRIPAIGLSLMTFFLSMFLAFLLDRISSTEMSVFSTSEIIPMIFYGFMIIGASFIICKAHPGSLWYTPFICNALGIIVGIFGAIDDPVFRTNISFWIVLGSYILLSVLGALLGARIGSYNNKQL